MLTFGSLFAGIGGFDLGFERAGMRCVWQVEIDPFCRKVLAKHWPAVRRWDDVRTFPPEPVEDWTCDVICGGFPCQDISVAGRGVGLDGARSGLWSEIVRVVRVLRPRIVVVENVAALLDRGMGRVLGDLATVGFDAEWDCLPAASFGAPHQRDRVFLVAYPAGFTRGRGVLPDRFDDVPRNEQWRPTQGLKSGHQWKRWLNETCQAVDGAVSASDFYGLDDGVPKGLDGHKPYGNAVVPQVAEWVARRLVEAAG